MKKKKENRRRKNLPADESSRGFLQAPHKWAVKNQVGWPGRPLRSARGTAAPSTSPVSLHWQFLWFTSIFQRKAQRWDPNLRGNWPGRQWGHWGSLDRSFPTFVWSEESWSPLNHDNTTTIQVRWQVHCPEGNQRKRTFREQFFQL